MLVIPQSKLCFQKFYSFLGGGGGPHPPFINVTRLGRKRYTIIAIAIKNKYIQN
jgi:hypothetical protein